MSEENVEIVRRTYGHWIATGEFTPEVVHPDFVWDMSTYRAWPERQTYIGLEGAGEFLADWVGAWEDLEFEVEDYIDAGEAGVVTIVRQHGRSKATGIPLDMHFGQVWTFREGKQFRMNMYASPEEALEAAGLRE
jgi:ketosteroid isomerase-like protein